MSRCRPFPDGALFWCLGCPGSSTARGCRNVADACSTDPDAGVLGALATDYLSTPGPDRSVVGDDQPADSYGRTVDHADSSIGLPSASHSAVRHGSGSVHTDTSRSAPSEPLHSSAASEQRPSFAVDDVLGESIDGTTGARHAEPHSSGGIFAGVQCGCSGDGRDRPPVKCGESSPLGLCPRGLRQAQGESLPRDLPRRSSYIRWICSRSKNASPAQLDFIKFSRAMNAQTIPPHQPASDSVVLKTRQTAMAPRRLSQSTIMLGF